MIVLADDEQIRQAAKAVFARSEFSDPGKPEDWSWLAKLFGQFAGWFRANPEFGWFVIVAIALALLALVAFGVWQLRHLFVERDRKTAPTASAAERLKRSGEYQALASAMAQAGSYTEAVRCLFLSLIYRFDEGGKVPFERSATNREYVALIDKPQLRQPLGVFVRTLDDYWYSKRTCGEAQYAECRRVFDSL